MIRWLMLLAVMMLVSGCGVRPPERNNAGNDHLRRGQLAEAVRAYQLAQVNAPDLPAPYFNLGVTQLERGDHRQAEAAFQQALRTADEQWVADIYFGLGEAYFRQAKYRQAIDAYRQVLLRRPDDTDARHNLQLSILRVPTETPTPSPTPTTTSTDEVQDVTSTPTRTATPTPESDIPQTVTPTPSPQSNADEATSQPTPEQNAPDTSPPMDEEAALELLDDVQQGQGVLYSPFSEVFSESAETNRDW